MNTIGATEIIGIEKIDPLLEEGPVHVFRHDQPRYVVMSEEQYQALLEDSEAAQIARVREVQAAIAAGRGRRFTSVAELMAAMDAIEDDATP